MEKFKKIWEWVSHGDTVWGILNMILPTLGGFGGGIISWFQSLPPIWVFFSILGGIALGLFISNEFSARRIRKRIATVTTSSTASFDTNGILKVEGFEFYPHRESITRFKDEISSAKEVWCFWQAGGTAKQNDVLGIRSIKKLILANPSEDNPAIEQIVTRMPDDATPSHVREMVKELASTALKRGIAIRLWTGFPCDVMVFANPMDDNAWVLVDIVLPHLSAEMRPQVKIWKRKCPQLYKNLLSVYNEIWYKSEEYLGN